MSLAKAILSIFVLFCINYLADGSVTLQIFTPSIDIKKQYFTINNRGCNKRLDANGGGSAYAHDKNTDIWQIWRLDPAKQILVNLATKQALDMEGFYSKDMGSRKVPYTQPPNGGQNQKWIVRTEYGRSFFILHVLSDSYLQLDLRCNLVSSFYCIGGIQNVLWDFRNAPIYYIVNQNGFYLTGFAGQINLIFQPFDPNNEGQQWWLRDKDNNDFMRIVSPKLGKVLDFNDQNSGISVYLNSDYDNDNQRFTTDDTGTYIKNKRTNKFIGSDSNNLPFQSADAVYLKLINV